MSAPSMPLDADYRRPARIGIVILVLGFGGFLLWGALAPLDEGVPAPGTVSVESRRKRVDHLTGGLIEKILVRDGQVVVEGDPLLELNETQARATLNAIEGEWRIAAATAARLEAERAGASSIAFPEVLLDAAADPEVASAMRAQSELFRSRRGALAGELAIVRESVRGLELQMKSIERVMDGRALQRRLFTEQYESFVKLHAEKFVSRNQLIDIERQLAEVQKALSTLGERLTAQRDTFRRLVLRAPVGGTVVDLAYFTLGGVIRPGDRILDIVPDGDQLIIEAQVAPQYIDRIGTGQPADVHFDAYMSRVDRPVLTGTVQVGRPMRWSIHAPASPTTRCVSPCRVPNSSGWATSACNRACRLRSWSRPENVRCSPTSCVRCCAGSRAHWARADQSAGVSAGSSASGLRAVGRGAASIAARVDGVSRLIRPSVPLR